MNGRCPLEQAVEVALVAAREHFTREPHDGQRLDFHLTERNVFIEVKAWHTPRISDQMASERNVIALQGPEAVAFFCTALARRDSDGSPKGGDGEAGSVACDDSAGPKDIAHD